ncbi:MAG: hypothetical protein ACYSW3_00135 [Planctomycetota bacterium]|jgi:hypothetical protein
MAKNGLDELITILVLGIIAIVAISLLRVGGKEIAIAIAGGLIGYLKGHSPGPETTPPPVPE